MTIKAPPPFSALRAIEAASRHRSYTWAARELEITHSAVSQSVKRLEAQLGTKLFERRGGAMEPSTAALQLAQAYADAAGALQRSLEDVAQAAPPQRLAVSMLSSFGRLWFAPRLSRLSRLLPDLVLDIRTRAVGTPGNDDSDLQIGVGLSGGSGWASERLCDVAPVPLCSPAFADRHRLLEPVDVTRVALISDRDMPWSAWLDAAGVAISPRRSGHVFDDMAMLLDAAARGDGLALAPVMFAQRWLQSGALVAPLGERTVGEEPLIVAWRTGGDISSLVDRVLDWLRGETRLPA
jgi:DNA-binding transcriptional LysR family regulator